MCAELLLDPGFYPRPLPGTGPGGHLATISSTLVFEALADAQHHLDQLTLHLDPHHTIVSLHPHPVRAHVPGTRSPIHPIGHRLLSSDAADPAAIARQVTALRTAAKILGMTTLHSHTP